MTTSNEYKQIKKGYIIPNENELSFYGYKEPLKKFEGGFGYMGVVMYNKEKDKVQCHFCGRLFRNVGVHAALKHHMDKNEYKFKTGLNLTSALCGEGTREKLMLNNKNYRATKTKVEVLEQMRKMSKKAVKGKKIGRHSWQLEKKNQNGTCPDQLLDKVLAMYKRNKEVPSIKEFREEYAGRYGTALITTFGSWRKVLEMCKLKSREDLKLEKYTNEKLLEYMRVFYQLHKRTPQQSDMKRGLLPSVQTYHNKFGSLNKARKLAGVPIMEFYKGIWTQTKGT